MALRIYLSSNGLFISKLGKNATSSNAADLIFSGLKSTRRSAMVGTCSYTTSAAHGLNYVPLFHVDYQTGYSGVFSVDASQFYCDYAGGGILRYTIFATQWV